MGRLPITVTYQDSCHLAHGQKVRIAPRKLLRAVPGLEFREMPLSDLVLRQRGHLQRRPERDGDGGARRRKWTT